MSVEHTLEFQNYQDELEFNKHLNHGLYRIRHCYQCL